MCHFLLQYACVCVWDCERVPWRPQPSGLVPWLSDSIWRGANWRGEPPPRRVLSEHEGLAAGSTNPGAPNSAICPAMCSHLPAGSTQCRACLTHYCVTVGLCCSRLGPALQWAWNGEMLVLVYLWVTCLALSGLTVYPSNVKDICYANVLWIKSSIKRHILMGYFGLWGIKCFSYLAREGQRHRCLFLEWCSD